jgi:hypothetical protein
MRMGSFEEHMSPEEWKLWKGERRMSENKTPCEYCIWFDTCQTRFEVDECEEWEREQ